MGIFSGKRGYLQDLKALNNIFRLNDPIHISKLNFNHSPKSIKSTRFMNFGAAAQY